MCIRDSLVIEQVTALFRGPRGPDEEWFPTPASRLTRRTKSCVREPVDLPAPYVTDTNEDFRVSSRWIDTYSLSAASAVREGKFSKVKIVGFALKTSWMCTGQLRWGPTMPQFIHHRQWPAVADGDPYRNFSPDADPVN